MSATAWVEDGHEWLEEKMSEIFRPDENLSAEDRLIFPCSPPEAMPGSIIHHLKNYDAMTQDQERTTR